jgi:hypothetical protein
MVRPMAEVGVGHERRVLRSERTTHDSDTTADGIAEPKRGWLDHRDQRRPVWCEMNASRSVLSSTTALRARPAP